jgi:hypothetical protein
MALISCPECRRQVSDRAASCPQCGYPIRDNPERSRLGGFSEAPLPAQYVGERNTGEKVASSSDPPPFALPTSHRPPIPRGAGSLQPPQLSSKARLLFAVGFVLVGVGLFGIMFCPGGVLNEWRTKDSLPTMVIGFLILLTGGLLAAFGFALPRRAEHSADVPRDSDRTKGSPE